MARRIALFAALAALVLPAVAGAATPARFFVGAPIDGPSADIQGLGDLDVARDGTGYAAVQQVADAGANPDVEMSINGVAYETWSSNGDVQAARLERNATSFNGVPGPLDIDPAAVAGTGTGRPKVTVAADGVATVVWGEGGHAYARRIFELRLSAAPQDLGEGADQPDISSEDDSSFAWAVFRQSGQAIARRLVGSQFDPPVPLENVEGSDAPRVAINGRGVGYAGVGGSATAAAYGAVLKDDIFNPGLVIGGGWSTLPAPAPAVAESGDGLIAFQQGDSGGGRTVHARPYDYVPASRLVTQPGVDATLSDPALGPTDAARGLDAAADRAGDVAVALRPRPRGFPRQHDHQMAQVRASTCEVGDLVRAVGTADLPRGDRRPAGGHDDVDRPHRAERGARRAAPLARRGHRHPRPEHRDALAQPARRRHPAQGQLQGLGLAQARPAGEGRRAGHRRDRHGGAGVRAGRRADLVRRRLAARFRAQGRASLRALGQGHGARQRDRQGGQRDRRHAADHDPQVARLPP